MPDTERTFILRLFKVPLPSPTSIKAGAAARRVAPERLRSMEISAPNLASAKAKARDTVTSRGHKIRSITFGAHNDLVVLVES